MISFVNVICEIIIFALYAFVDISLSKMRFKKSLCGAICALVIIGICGGFTALALSGRGQQALTLLPLIAYLPFSVCVFVLSESGAFECAAACSVAALSSLTVKILKKIVQCGSNGLNGAFYNAAIIGTVTLLAPILAYIVFKYTRPALKKCLSEKVQNRSLIMFPAATLFLMIFININSVSSAAVLIMTLIITVSFFAVALKLFDYWARLLEAAETEKLLFEDLERQRKSYEKLSEDIDDGKIYRHDMRHHLKVLSGMAEQNNSTEILEYIGKLSEQNERAASPTLCANPAVNAVISDYFTRAKALKCKFDYRINISENLPFELPDVCIILANALENALNENLKIAEGNRYIKLYADFSDDSKLKISVKNPCVEDVRIDKNNLPVVKSKSEGHGIGLRGVEKTAEKYNGFVCCMCKNKEFHFCAEIFHTPKAAPQSEIAVINQRAGSKDSKALPAVLTSIICAIGLLNLYPASAKALSEVLSVKIKTISFGWGDNSFKAELPEFTGEGSDKLNAAARDFVSLAKDIFNQYSLTKYEGYVAEDAGYRVYRDDGKWFSVRFYATLNAGGSADFSRCVTLDKQSGETVTLGDLFEESYDYIGAISEEILRQMEFAVQYQNAHYFIPGGIWSDEECFKQITPEQEFYIDAYGHLVIVFDEYTVAPGDMGSPEFIMPESIFKV